MESPAELEALDAAVREWRGSSCAYSEPVARVVADASEWRRLWNDAFSAPAPEVDFSKYFAAAVFLGLRATGGYSVEFLPPAVERDAVVVRHRTRSPSPGSFVIQALTQPYAIRLYRKTPSPVRISEVR
ncbi:MAG: protease complex subunit PrcB family protein [Elusimicrobia bacterium]|nr:protease complex subunit PrcB family protein [Elusimicrobiota bacterium]